MAEKIIIIGAGLSGLTTARELKRKGYDIQVIEARDRVAILLQYWSMTLVAIF